MTMASSVDWPGLVQAVATSLVGEPTHKTATEWRFRRRGSLAINVAGEHAGQWYDFEAGVGGGGVDLVTHLMGCDRSAAVAWLQDQRLLPDTPGRVAVGCPVPPPKPVANRADPPDHADRVAWREPPGGWVSRYREIVLIPCDSGWSGATFGTQNCRYPMGCGGCQPPPRGVAIVGPGASSPLPPSHWSGHFPGPSCRRREVSNSSRLPLMARPRSWRPGPAGWESRAAGC